MSSGVLEPTEVPEGKAVLLDLVQELDKHMRKLRVLANVVSDYPLDDRDAAFDPVYLLRAVIDQMPRLIHNLQVQRVTERSRSLAKELDETNKVLWNLRNPGETLKGDDNVIAGDDDE